MGQNRHSTRKTTRRIATCGVFCALAVVMLGLGAIIEVLDITASAVYTEASYPDRSASRPADSSFIR